MPKAKPQSARNNDWPTTKETRTLPTRLNSLELKTYSKELNRNIATQDELALEAKAMASHFKSRIEACSMRVRTLATILDSEKEPRETVCVWRFECDGLESDGTARFDSNKKTLFRVDQWVGDEEPVLGEVVEVAPISDADRERALPLEEEPAL